MTFVRLRDHDTITKLTEITETKQHPETPCQAYIHSDTHQHSLAGISPSSTEWNTVYRLYALNIAHGCFKRFRHDQLQAGRVIRVIFQEDPFK